MQNPVKRILKEKEISMIELAKLADVGYSTVSSLKYGFTKSINSNLLSVFEKLGYNQKEIVSQYKRFREKESKNLIKEVR